MAEGQSINPFTHLGDTLNHLDRIMDLQTALIGEVARLAVQIGPDKVSPELFEAARRLAAAVSEYRQAKLQWLSEQNQGDGQNARAQS